MTKPRQLYFTVGQLAKEWARHEISKSNIRHYHETGQLKRWKRFMSKITGEEVFLEVPFTGWGEDGQETSWINDRDDLEEVFTDGKDRDFILLEEVERFEKTHLKGSEQALPYNDKKSVKMEDHSTPKAVGGKPKSPLTEAVEFFYSKCVLEGKTDVIKSGNINIFINKLREHKASAPDDFSNFVGERIKDIRKIRGIWKITTNEIILKDSDHKETVIKEHTYNANHISKILTRLRKENPALS